jgi:hypothetical protein
VQHEYHTTYNMHKNSHDKFDDMISQIVKTWYINPKKNCHDNMKPSWIDIINKKLSSHYQKNEKLSST